MNKNLILITLAVGVIILAASVVSVRTRVLSGDKRFMDGSLESGFVPSKVGSETDSALSVLSESMPEFTAVSAWLNSAPLTPESLKGKVTLIDFWTYSCINCIRTLPYVTSWQEKYSGKGFTVVGVHTPEFAFEKEESNVRKAIGKYGITYPVALDNSYGTWNAYENRYWPAHYLFDAKGRLRYAHFGEGKYEETEAAIQQLLKEAGQDASAAITEYAGPEFGKIRSPETYIGYSRTEGLESPDAIARDKEFRYTAAKNLKLNRFSLSGIWKVEEEKALAGSDARLSYRYSAGVVNLVMGGQGQRVGIMLDGQAVPESMRGADVTVDAEGKTSILLDGERLYELINGHGVYGEHLLELKFESGVEVYAFTFG